MKIFHSIILLLFLGASQISAQILEPVKWSFTSEKVSETDYNLIFTAEIDDAWTVYSQFTPNNGPEPTSLTFESIEGATLSGKAKEEGHKKEEMDKIFEVKVIKFLGDKDFVITQKVKITDNSKPISGYLTFMTCNNKTCLPPTDIDFSFSFKNGSGEGSGSNSGNGSSSSFDGNQKEEDISSSAAEIKIGEVKFTNAPAANSVTDGEQTDKPSGLLEPVKWQMTKTQISEDEYELVFNATIDKGWAVYSQFMEEGGPVPTSITYENSEGIEMLGESIEEGHKKEGPDPLFEDIDKVIKFLDDQDFTIRQRIKILDANKPLTGYLTFMTCDSKRCLNPTDIDFDFGFGTLASDIAEMSINEEGKIDQTRPTIKATYSDPLSDCGEESAANTTNLWLLFLGGMLGGFAALLTPCVFPMIPITVSFFTKDTKRKGWVNATIYGISIIVIYVALGLLITATLGPTALQALSTNWIANVLFFLIFIFFAGSFFGYYELTLPSSWTNKSDQMADKGGLIGIFFMAATLALVSFSCTGPIIGTALVAAANGGQLGPAIIMSGFAFALAVPFGLFAAFPAWLNSLPKSGGWMNSVKVVLGFLELGFAFKFLSTADLTQHWGILKYELFMFILITVCLCIAAYLLGFIKFPHDSPIKKLNMTRKVLATSFVALAIYLGFGFNINKDTGIYDSLWLTSGFSPPVMYNLFLEKGEVDPAIKERYPSFTKCANNIDCFKDYYEGMAYAKEVGKPAFLDFTGHGCQNCRRTEDKIWVNDKIRNTLNNDVVLISLYTDDREELEEILISANSDKKLRNVGHQWADFQVVNFAQNSQPLYIMMTNDEEVITHPRGYEDGVQSYQSYLECGLDYYHSN